MRRTTIPIAVFTLGVGVRQVAVPRFRHFGRSVAKTRNKAAPIGDLFTHDVAKLGLRQFRALARRLVPGLRRKSGLPGMTKETAFLVLLADRAGYRLDVRGIDRRDDIAAIITAFRGDEAPLAGVLRGLIG